MQYHASYNYSANLHTQNDTILLFLLPIILLFHISGILLTSLVIHSRRYRIQHLLILNYSLCVAATDMALITDIIAHRTSLKPELKEKFCIWPFIFYHVLFCGMIFITLDRLLEVLLNIKYPLYITKNRVVNGIAFSWFLGIFCSIVISLQTTIERILEVYPSVRTAIDVLYISFVIVSYMVIFYYFKRSRSHPSFNHPTQSVGALATFRQSKFYVALILVLSFIIFIIGPDLLLTRNRRVTQDIRLSIDIGYFISSVLDAMLYISLDGEIKRVLLKVLKVKRVSQVSPRVRSITATTNL